MQREINNNMIFIYYIDFTELKLKNINNQRVTNAFISINTGR